MKLILFAAQLLIFYSGIVASAPVNDGLYYSYWVYKKQGELKEYPVLENKPRTANGRYILSNVTGRYSGDEIYIKVTKGNPSIFYRQTGEETVTKGWANARFSGENIIASASTVIIKPDDIQEKLTGNNDIYVGDEFTGKSVPLNKNEIIPITNISNDSFTVNCNDYLDKNHYRNNEIPDYDEAISADENTRQSYGGTIFISGDNICALFLSNDSVSEIKDGWILFKKLL
ncbi:hypothetical protein ACGVWS_04145 [Enterobacteriaceae bacterium LUAb1]